MLKVVALTLGLVILVGCDTVSIDKPIGEAFTKKEKASLVGSWVTDGGNVTEIRKTKQGDLVLGSLSWDEKQNKFKAESNAIVPTTIGKSNYLFIKSEEGENEFLFCRFIRKDDSNVELYLPDPKVFRSVVEESIAASRKESSKAFGVIANIDQSKASGVFEVEDANFSVKLSSESKGLLEFFDSSKIDACFDNEAILKYRKISR